MRLRILAIALGFVTSLAGPGQAQGVAQEPSVELPGVAPLFVELRQ